MQVLELVLQVLELVRRPAHEQGKAQLLVPERKYCNCMAAWPLRVCALLTPATQLLSAPLEQQLLLLAELGLALALEQRWLQRTCGCYRHRRQRHPLQQPPFPSLLPPLTAYPWAAASRWGGVLMGGWVGAINGDWRVPPAVAAAHVPPPRHGPRRQRSRGCQPPSPRRWAPWMARQMTVQPWREVGAAWRGQGGRRREQGAGREVPVSATNTNGTGSGGENNKHSAPPHTTVAGYQVSLFNEPVTIGVNSDVCCATQ